MSFMSEAELNALDRTDSTLLKVLAVTTAFRVVFGRPARHFRMLCQTFTFPQ